MNSIKKHKNALMRLPKFRFNLIAILALIFSFCFVSQGLEAAAWTQVNREPGGTFKAVVYGGGTFVALGDGGLVRTSTNGTNWTNRNAGTVSNLYGATFANGLFVAVGQKGIIITSSNGSSWTTRSDGGDSFIGVAYGGGLYAAGGSNGRITTSPDGVTWTDHSIGNVEIWDMSYGNGLFVAAAAGGKIYSSADGISWTKSSTNTGGNNYSVTYASGQFVLGGQLGLCYTSANGTSWTKRSSGTENYFMSIARTDKHWVAVGNSDGFTCSMALVSSTGSSWVRDKTPDFSTLLGVAAGNGIVVAVGSRRLIIRNTYAGVGEGAGCSKTNPPPPPPSGDTITVTSPNGGESWAANTTQTITWNSSKSYDKVDIEYYNGSSWVVVVSGTPDDGSYSWTVPNTQTSQAKIWMKGWHSDGNAVDYSDAVFTIASPAEAPTSVNIVYPNGGEKMASGSTQAITWTTTGTVTKIDIEYTTDGGNSWNVLVTGTADDGTHLWTVPNSPNTNKTRIWIKAWGPVVNDTDYSDGYFSIGGSLTVTAPNGGEELVSGETENITWTTTGSVGNVKVEYSTNSGTTWSTIASSTANDGSHPWTVPDTISTTCLVRVSELSGYQVTDQSNSSFSIIGIPELVLDKSSFSFGAVSGGTTPLAQTMIVSNAGGGTMDWVATAADNADSAWLTLSPSSGSGSAAVSLNVNSAGLAAGSYSATITVTANGADNSPQTANVTLNVINSSADQPPFGMVGDLPDKPTFAGSLPFTGWALDDVEVASVKVYRVVNGGDSYIGDAVFVEGARPDVAGQYPDYPLNTRAGWGYMLLTNFLPDGELILKAIAKDVTGYEVVLGTKTVIIDNENGTLPFGAIDSPAQGGNANGTKYRNNGWALAAKGNTIPTDGSTINVYVDAVAIGKATYNLYREDIATLFPGYSNSNGAWGYLDFDTTAYSNGVHTISWSVKDNNGNSDGIGSRYFTIKNVESRTSTQKRNTFRLPLGLKHANLKRHQETVSKDYTGTVSVRSGYSADQPGRQVYADDNGVMNVEMKELGRIQLDLDEEPAAGRSYTGFMNVNGKLSRLPIGSTLDTQTGRFYFQAGPGFTSSYDLIFFITENGLTTKKHVKININR